MLVKSIYTYCQQQMYNLLPDAFTLGDEEIAEKNYMQQHNSEYEEIEKAYKTLDFAFIIRDKEINIFKNFNDIEEAGHLLDKLKVCEIKNDFLVQSLIFKKRDHLLEIYSFKSNNSLSSYFDVTTTLNTLLVNAEYQSACIMLLEMGKIIHIKPLLSVCKAWNEGRFAEALNLPTDLNDKIAPECYVLSAHVVLPKNDDTQKITIQCCSNNKKVLVFLNNIITVKNQSTQCIPN